MARVTPNDNRTKSTPTLYLAMELSRKTWKLAFCAGNQTVRCIDVPGGCVEAVQKAATAAKKKLGLPPGARVLSCYEAGRDGFWIHRALVEAGFENKVIDPSSIEVDRRAKRAKTDRLDARKLVLHLVRHDERGDRMRVVHVPNVQQEDARRSTRELERLKKELTQHRSRIYSLLALHGHFHVRLGGHFPIAVDLIKTSTGALPPKLKAELLHEFERLQLVRTQIADLERQRRAELRAGQTPVARTAATLMLLRGIGPVSATICSAEFFSWRTFKNRKEVGSAAGMAGTPYDSGGQRREQGISKAGNRRVRWVLTEIAWSWLRHQPQSAVSLWYQRRFAHGSAGGRRIGIVALGRRLLVAFWRLVDHGEIPDGALLKT